MCKSFTTHKLVVPADLHSCTLSRNETRLQQRSDAMASKSTDERFESTFPSLSAHIPPHPAFTWESRRQYLLSLSPPGPKVSLSFRRRREGRPADSGFSGSSRGGRPRERDDYRPSYSGAGDSYRRDDSYRPPAPARDYHHSEPYAGSRAAAPRSFDDRYSGRDNGYSSSRRKSPSPYYSSSRPSSSRYRERSRSYSPLSKYPASYY